MQVLGKDDFRMSQMVDEQDLKQLCVKLWSWQLCEACQTQQACELVECPARRLKRLTKFLAFYKSAVTLAEQQSPDFRVRVLESIDRLKQDPGLKKGSTAATSGLGDTVDEAIDLAAQLLTMTNIFHFDQASEVLLEEGRRLSVWKKGVLFSQFLVDCFPMSDHPRINGDKVEDLTSARHAIRARKLQSRAGLRFVPTDDLTRHLKLDRRYNIVEIFHHVAFLKEHLRLTKDGPTRLSVEQSLKRGALPRQLAVEVVDSIQKVLFPASDAKSRAILNSLVSSCETSFDSECQRLDFVETRRPDERWLQYYYFGDRLAELLEEVENPRPHHRLGKILERWSRARHLTLITISGVLLAVMLGMAALVVGIAQTWISYQAWKHPVPQSQP
ncbi:hypothetical protein LTR06_005605 [Exophiala xenobiotica]|nr:hypothetical protein LTR06_005605 [Exophiala xenobiotica]